MLMASTKHTDIDWLTDWSEVVRVFGPTLNVVAGQDISDIRVKHVPFEELNPKHSTGKSIILGCADPKHRSIRLLAPRDTLMRKKDMNQIYAEFNYLTTLSHEIGHVVWNATHEPWIKTDGLCPLWKQRVLGKPPASTCLWSIIAILYPELYDLVSKVACAAEIVNEMQAYAYQLAFAEACDETFGETFANTLKSFAWMNAVYDAHRCVIPFLYLAILRMHGNILALASHMRQTSPDAIAHLLATDTAPRTKTAWIAVRRELYRIAEQHTGISAKQYAYSPVRDTAFQFLCKGLPALRKFHTRSFARIDELATAVANNPVVLALKQGDTDSAISYAMQQVADRGKRVAVLCLMQNFFNHMGNKTASSKAFSYLITRF